MKKVMFIAALMLTLGSGARADQFLLFGEGGKYYAAHMSDGQVNYNEVVSISQPYTLFNTGCGRRLCLDGKATPVKDSDLPVVVNSNGIPVANDYLGIFDDVHAQVIKVLYADGKPTP